MTLAGAATFNSPLEAGLRVIAVLVPAYPNAFDLQRLVAFDYLVVHSGDMGGPDSLHPGLPQRQAELLVRRSVVERGLHLLMHRGLVERELSTQGLQYRAGDLAQTILDSFVSPYIASLRERGAWVVSTFGGMSEADLRAGMARVFGHWIEEFQAVQRSLAFES